MSPLQRLGGPDPERGTATEYLSPGRFAGRTALVTGAGSGIGRATARRLAAEGAAVACLDIAEDAVAQVVDEIAEAAATAPEWAPGGRGLALRCDVTDEGSVADAVARATAELGPVTAVCNVAGIGRLRPHRRPDARGLEQDPLGQPHRHLPGHPGHPARPARARWVDHQRGVDGRGHGPGLRRGLRGVQGRGLHAGQGPGRRVRGQGRAGERGGPGGVDTPLVWEFGPPADADPKQVERMMTPMGFCSPAEVAAAIAFLASDEAGYISGADPLGRRGPQRLSGARRVPGSAGGFRAGGGRRPGGRPLRWRSTPPRCWATRPGSGPSAPACSGGWPAGRPPAAWRSSAFAVSWRRRHGIEPLLPTGVAAVGRAMPARPLHRAWGHGGPPARVVHRAGRRGARDQLRGPAHPAGGPRAHGARPDHGALPRALRRARPWPTPTSSAGPCGAAPTSTRRRPTWPPRWSRPWAPTPSGCGPCIRGSRHSPSADPSAARGRLPAGTERYVLAVGTAEPRKDLPGLVRAFDQLAGERADLALVLAGPDGWGTEALAAAIDASAHRRRVVRTGWVDPGGLSALVRGAAVLAYPSLYEGFGFPPLQAMAAGVPVVATTAGALPEVLGDAAALVPAADPRPGRRPGRGARRPGPTGRAGRRRAGTGPACSPGTAAPRGSKPSTGPPPGTGREHAASWWPSSSSAGRCPGGSAATPAALVRTSWPASTTRRAR